jgi:hypothetical protein
MLLENKNAIIYGGGGWTAEAARRPANVVCRGLHQLHLRLGEACGLRARRRGLRSGRYARAVLRGREARSPSSIHLLRGVRVRAIACLYRVPSGIDTAADDA